MDAVQKPPVIGPGYQIDLERSEISYEGKTAEVRPVVCALMMGFHEHRKVVDAYVVIAMLAGKGQLVALQDVGRLVTELQLSLSVLGMPEHWLRVLGGGYYQWAPGADKQPFPRLGRR